MLFLAKCRRLFFDDARLAAPAVIWLALSLLLPPSMAPVWHGAFLFGGFGAILVFGTVVGVAKAMR